jgi:hypothetical protein
VDGEIEKTAEAESERGNRKRSRTTVRHKRRRNQQTASSPSGTSVPPGKTSVNPSLRQIQNIR